MTMSEREQASLLDKALAALQQGDSLPQVLSAYEHAQPWLGPLLDPVQQLQELEPEPPRRSYVVRSRTRLMNRFGQQRSREAATRRKSQPRFAWLRQPALALASLALALVLALSMSGVVYAASGALPGGPLYGVKRGVEAARVGLALSHQSKVELLHEQVNERAEELQALQAAGRTEDLDTALAEYDSSLGQLLFELSQAETETETLAEIGNSFDRNNEVLQALSTTVPEAAVPGLQNAIEKSGQGKDVIEGLRNGIPPSEFAPGQNSDLTPPGQDPDFVPPGEGPDVTPPGQDPDRTPPGQDPERTPGPPPGAGSQGAGPNH